MKTIAAAIIILAIMLLTASPMIYEAWGETWKDNCNNCTGDKNGVYICTTMYCGDPVQPVPIPIAEGGCVSLDGKEQWPTALLTLGADGTATATDDIIKALAKSGDICRVYGHWWYSIVETFTLQVCYNDYGQVSSCPQAEKQKCNLCGLEQVFRPGTWEDVE